VATRILVIDFDWPNRAFAFDDVSAVRSPTRVRDPKQPTCGYGAFYFDPFVRRRKFVAVYARATELMLRIDDVAIDLLTAAARVTCRRYWWAFYKLSITEGMRLLAEASAVADISYDPMWADESRILGYAAEVAGLSAVEKIKRHELWLMMAKGELSSDPNDGQWMHLEDELAERVRRRMDKTA